VMNWQIKDLEDRAIVSFGDAHSPKKLGREVTVFEVEGDKLTFEALREGFKKEGKGCRISYTLEFYPEEGKYHYTGHRKCGVRQSPEETRKKGTSCHVCGKSLTVGVMHRVDELARGKEIKAVKKVSEAGVVGYYHPEDKLRPPYVMMVPLQEIISEAVGVGVNSKRVQEAYEQLVASLGSELDVLMKVKIEEIAKSAGERVAEAMDKVRKGEIVIKPGYDGVFGEVKIWEKAGEKEKVKGKTEQQTLF